MKIINYILIGFMGILLITSSYASTVGTGAGVNDLIILNCHNDNNCDDENPSTSDICVNPETYESFCENIPDTTPPRSNNKIQSNKKGF